MNRKPLSAHLWGAGLVIVEVKVNDVPHFLSTAVNHPVMAVKGLLTCHPLTHTSQRTGQHSTAHTRQTSMRMWQAVKLQQSKPICFSELCMSL